MGLDITAHKQLRKIDCVFDSSGEPIDPVTRESIDYDCRPFVNPHFPERAKGIDADSVFSSEESFGFRAGSYGGYNLWREELAKLAGYEAVPVDRHNTGKIQLRHDHGAFQKEEGPFFELINFSDCEGVIGAEVSRKLKKDFEDWDDRAKIHGVKFQDNDFFYSRYRDFRKAFEMASDDGAVEFH